MKKISVLFCVLALVASMILSSCTSQPTGSLDSTTASDPVETTEEVVDTTLEEETTSEIKPPEGMEDVEVSLTSLTADGESFVATVLSPVDLEGKLFLTFKKGSQVLEYNFVLDLMENEPCNVTGEGVPFLEETYTLDVEVVVEDYVIDQYTVSFNRGAPQLDARSVDLVVSAMSVREKASFVVAWPSATHMAATTYGTKTYGIKSIKLADGPAGIRTIGSTMAYPSGMNLASTWDVEMMESIASSLGDDCVQYGVGVLLGPGMNIQKNVLGGRNFEYFSEDPFLTGMMAAYYTIGVQSHGVGIALKHFAVNNQETDRGAVSATLTERALREIYLRGFEYAVKVGQPYTVMSSYNRLNDAYTATRRDLLETILRDEFGFDGLVMSDWGAQGGRMGMLLAGNDLACGFGENAANEVALIARIVEEGRLDEEYLNTSCKRVLELLVKTAATADRNISNTIANRTEKDALARKAAAESMVLLKNENAALPMAAGELALFGANSYNLVYCGGGSGHVNADGVAQLPGAIANTAGYSINQTIADRYSVLGQHQITLSVAATAAAEADYAIFTIIRESVEGNDHKVIKGDYLLSDDERVSLQNISEAFHAEGKPVIVLLNVGDPIEVASWRDLADAILWVGFAGEEIGNAIMDVLTGAVNPCGKLTMTWPIAYEDVPDADYFGSTGSVLHYEDIYVGYRYYTTFEVDVAYPFGHGLSYTSFEYSDFTMVEENGEYRLSVTVKNTGNAAGREVVQFYVTKPDNANEHPEMELVGFDKTALLAPGASETVTVTVTPEELKTYYTDDSDWIVEKGEYTVYVCASVEDVRGQKAFTIDEEILVLDTVNACEPTKRFDVLTKY